MDSSTRKEFTTEAQANFDYLVIDCDVRCAAVNNDTI